MKKFLLIFLTATIVGSSYLSASGSASEQTQDESVPTAQRNFPKITVGGTFFLATYYDSYKSVDNRSGVSYSYPKAPHYDDFGKDLNKVSQFGMSVYQTRLSVDATDLTLLGAKARLFVETDFMGSSSDFVQMLRLRHAFLELKWERNELLFGQTNNVEVAEEVGSGIITAGAGNPIVVLSRPIMIRYGRRLSPGLKAFGSLSFHRRQIGPTEANRTAAMPSFEAKLEYDNGTDFVVGITAGFRHLRPQTEYSFFEGNREYHVKSSSTLNSGNGSLFFKYIFGGGYSIKGQTFYGSDLSHLGMIGGYAYTNPIAGADYKYTNLVTSSSWLEIETKSFNDFRFGLFGGFMKNLGMVKEMEVYGIYARDADLTHTGRISPRFTYTYRNLLMGIEYSYFWSKWGREFDDRHKAIDSFKTTVNNRITLLVRYRF